MHKSDIIVLCGLPGSGKSTLVSTLSDYYTSSNIYQTIIHVDYDFYFSMPQSRGMSQKKVRGIIVEALKNSIDPQCRSNESSSELFKAILSHCTLQKLYEQNNNLIDLYIIDDTMHYRSMRKLLCQLSMQLNCRVVYVHVQCPLLTCMERNDKRKSDEKVSMKSIDKIALKFQPPHQIVAWEKNRYTTYCSITEDISQLCTSIKQLMSTPVYAINKNELPKVNCEHGSSNRERLELMLRDKIHSILSEMNKIMPALHMRIIVQEVHAIKTSVYKRLRTSRDENYSNHIVLEGLRQMEELSKRKIGQ